MSALGIFNGPRTKPAHIGGLGAAPGQYWPDSRVKSLQTQLSSQLAASGCSTVLKSDGLIGPGTCGALAWAKASGAPPLAYTSAAKDMDAGCSVFKTLTAPSCPSAAAPAMPAPALPPPPLPGPAPVSPAGPGPTASTKLSVPILEPPKKTAATAPSYVPVAPPATLAPSAQAGMSTGLKIGIGVAAVALVGFAVFAKSKSRKAA